MAIPTIVDDGGDDELNPQDDQQGKIPTLPDEKIDMPVEDGENAPDPGQEALDIQGQLDAVEPSEDDDVLDAGDIPDNKPEPFTPPAALDISAPTISDPGAPGFSDEFGGVDLSEEVSTDKGDAGPPTELADLDAAARDFDAMGRDIEAFHAGPGVKGLMDDGGPVGGDGGASLQQELPGALDADYQNRDTMTGFLVQHTRNLQELKRRLENERL